LRAALGAVERGCPVQTTALDFDIPRTTLRSHLMGITLSRKRGRKPVLIPTKEDKVVKYIHSMGRLGYPMSLTELRIKVAEATQLCQNPFTDGIPGRGWLRWFRFRHPEVSLQLSQGLDVGRVKGLYPSNVATF
jgi:hypothetical protein